MKMGWLHFEHLFHKHIWSPCFWPKSKGIGGGSSTKVKMTNGSEIEKRGGQNL
jgi:hypothetical protein